MPTPVTVKKWRSSLVVLIPPQFAQERRIKIGTVLDLDHLRVIKRRRRYKLSELVARFKQGHRHREWDLGDPVGKEIW
jgi:antitoxin component of MazEF toxin-antitoxin module